MKTQLSFLLGFASLLSLSLSFSVFSATPPTPSGYATGGLFSVYFQNIVKSGGSNPSGVCADGYAVVGFSTGGSDYGTPVCQEAAGYWKRTTDNDLYYTGGRVFVGTNTGTADLSVSGSITANVYYFNNGGSSPIPGWDTNFTWTWAGNNIYNLNTGNVGIGVSAPTQKVDILGYANTSSGYCIGGSCITAWSLIQSQWTTSGTTIYYNGGNVGIGTNNPLRLLSLSGGGLAFQEPGGSTRNIHWGDSDTDTWPVMIAGDSKAGKGYFVIATGPFGTNGTERLRVDSSGNVGIGTNNPTATLTVSGNVIANDPTASNHVATKAYVDAAVSAGGGGVNVYKYDGTTLLGKFLQFNSSTPTCENIVYTTAGGGWTQLNAQKCLTPTTNIYYRNSTCTHTTAQRAIERSNNTGYYKVNEWGTVPVYSTYSQNYLCNPCGTCGAYNMNLYKRNVTTGVCEGPFTVDMECTWNLNVYIANETTCGLGPCKLQ